MVIIIPEPEGTPDATEMEFMRFNTKEFINADPISVQLTRTARTRSAEGGYQKGSSAPLAAQTFRLIPQTDAAVTVQTPDGVQLTSAYVLLGEYDCDMERWDEFTLDGIKFKIVSPIRPDFRDPDYWYERKADVARL